MANLKELLVNGVSRFIGKVYINDSHITTINDVPVTENPKFTDTTDLGSMTGTLGVAHGGTGQTNGKNAANYFMNQLDTGSSTPADNDYYISQFVNGGTTTTTYHRRPMSALWAYIKGKIDNNGGYTNKNEFGKVKVGSTTIEADAIQDTLELVQGSNITLTADASNDKVTISATDTTYAFDGTYNASTNKAATVSTVTNAINALDGGTIGTPSASKTLTALSETNGNISATFGDISITKSQVSDFSHIHGNIQNDGTLQTNDITIASGDKLVVTDSSDSSKVARTSISFDGSTTTKALTPKGTWENFTNNTGTVTSVGITNGTGISVTGSPITTSGSITITNTGVTGVKGNAETDYRTGDVIISAANIGLGNVENKSSATIRGELTSANVTNALGYTPYNSTNPNGYTSNTGTVTSVQVQATSPVQSSSSSASSTTLNTTISLANGYGDTQNPYGSKDEKQVLATPNNESGVPSFRNLLTSDIFPLQKKVYTDVIGTADNWAGATFFFASIRPTTWDEVWEIKYRIRTYVPNMAGYDQFADVLITGYRDALKNYYSNNTINTSVAYYHNLYRLKQAGYNNGYGHLLGISLRSTNYPTNTNYKRTIEIELCQTRGCAVTFLDNCIKYADASGTGSTNYNTYSEINYISTGLQECSDSNDANYQNRVYYALRKTYTSMPRYQMAYTMKDAAYVFPTTTISNNVATLKTFNTTTPFDPFGEIYYYSSTTLKDANTVLGDGTLYRQILCDLRYTFNIIYSFQNSITYAVGDYVIYGEALYKCTTAHPAANWNASHFTVQAPKFATNTAYSVNSYVMYNYVLYKCTTAHAAGAWNANHFTRVSKIEGHNILLVARMPVYLVAVPQSDGSAVLHSDPITQDLPQSADNLIYIYLGNVYPDTVPYRIDLTLNHPVYEYKNGAIRQWINAAVDAVTVNGHTVNKDVPSDAKFTDTTYESKPAVSGGTDVSLVTTGEKYTWNSKTSNTGTVTSVQVQATSPVQSSTSTASSTTLSTTISLADGYGDTKNPYASKTKNYVLAAPTSQNGAPSFRALDASDIPNLSWSKITSGKPTTISGYGITDALTIGTTASTAMAGNTNVNNVAQTATTTNAAYELLFSGTADNTTRNEGARKTSTLTYNPSTKALVTGGTVNGYTLAAASAKGVDTSISENSSSPNLPTSAAVAGLVSSAIAASDAMIFKGTLGTGGTVTALPTTYKTGWTYRVITAGTYAGNVCEVGDLIIALVDRSGSGNVNADWTVAQTNVDGAITTAGGTINGTLTVDNALNANSASIGNLVVTGDATFANDLHGNLVGTINGYTPIRGGSNASSSVTITPSTTDVYSMSTAGSVTAGTANTPTVINTSKFSGGSFTRGAFSGGSFTQGTDSFTQNTPTAIDTSKFNGGSFTRGAFSGGSFTQGADSFTQNTPTAIDTSKFSGGSFTRGAFSGGSFTQGTDTFTQNTPTVIDTTKFNGGSFTRGTFNAGSLTMAMDTTDTKKLIITFTPPSHGNDSFTAASLSSGFYTAGTKATFTQGTDSFTAATHANDSFTPASLATGFYTAGTKATFTQGTDSFTAATHANDSFTAASLANGFYTAGTKATFTQGTDSFTPATHANDSFTAASLQSGFYTAGTANTPTAVTLPQRSNVIKAWTGYSNATAAAQTFTGTSC